MKKMVLAAVLSVAIGALSGCAVFDTVVTNTGGGPTSKMPMFTDAKAKVKGWFGPGAVEQANQKAEDDFYGPKKLCRRENVQALHGEGVLQAGWYAEDGGDKIPQGFPHGNHIRGFKEGQVVETTCPDCRLIRLAHKITIHDYKVTDITVEPFVAEWTSLWNPDVISAYLNRILAESKVVDAEKTSLEVSK